MNKVTPFYEKYSKEKPFVMGPVSYTPAADSQKPVQEKMDFIKQVTSQELVIKCPTYSKPASLAAVGRV